MATRRTFSRTRSVSLIFSVCIREMANLLTLALVVAMTLSFGEQDWIKESSLLPSFSSTSVGFFLEYKTEKTTGSVHSLFSYCYCGTEWCSDLHMYHISHEYQDRKCRTRGFLSPIHIQSRN
ncbi:hypothetical protein K435DRAFT_682730 [Dendrothele bispora CBS 962.96]|uniref:Uncharacterized protein n=1 Tax=Dendrothele bispora (strain CBS 962.96) TaxID=1314807 RepID=A0A4S8LDA1_DENBC|nr:hypothetical protein K435DRAFT_682730 [Dendrothele bispora CBS 962.96]